MQSPYADGAGSLTVEVRPSSKRLTEFQRAYGQQPTGRPEDVESQLALYHDHGLLPPFPPAGAASPAPSIEPTGAARLLDDAPAAPGAGSQATTAAPGGRRPVFAHDAQSGDLDPCTDQCKILHPEITKRVDLASPMIHPDYAEANSSAGPKSGREAHNNHVHAQLGPTRYPRPRPR